MTYQNLFRKVLRNPEHVLHHQLLQPVPASTHSYSGRTWRIMDKWRTLLRRDVTGVKQFTCLHSDYSCSSRNKWLLLDQHHIGSVDRAEPSTDCCGIDRLLRHRRIYRWRSAISRWRKSVSIAIVATSTDLSMAQRYQSMAQIRFDSAWQLYQLGDIDRRFFGLTISYSTDVIWYSA